MYLAEAEGLTAHAESVRVRMAKKREGEGIGEKGKRMSNISRQTRETEISLALQLDGMGQTNLKTGVPFLEHMLDLFAKHGQFDLFVEAKGDTHIDDHHTVEDIAICLGQALREALGDKKGIRRYGNAFVPMDEALGQVVVDLSNRPHLEFRAEFPSERVGSFETELVHEFFWKFALEARIDFACDSSLWPKHPSYD